MLYRPFCFVCLFVFCFGLLGQALATLFVDKTLLKICVVLVVFKALLMAPTAHFCYTSFLHYLVSCQFW